MINPVYLPDDPEAATMTTSRRILAPLALALALAACGGGGEADSAAPSGDGTVRVEASDLAYDPTQLQAQAGTVEFELDNVGAAVHDLAIEEAGDQVVVEAGPGESATGSIELEAGSYTFYCTVPGHRDAGMEGTLEVG